MGLRTKILSGFLILTMMLVVAGVIKVKIDTVVVDDDVIEVNILACMNSKRQTPVLGVKIRPHGFEKNPFGLLITQLAPN